MTETGQGRYDLLIRGGTLVTEAGGGAADVAIAEGRIAAIAPELEGGGREEIDAAGRHLFPGVIDAHVHFNEPGRTDWEGWASGSRALAAGGGTTALEMPLNAHPPTVDGPAFDAKRAAAETSSVVDFGLWGGLVPGNLDRLDELADRGVVGFKAFMSDSGIGDFPAVDDRTLLDGMERAAALGVLVAVHAESEAITSRLAARARSEGRTGVRDYLRSRPAVAETEAIGRALALAEAAGCALHVVHVSTGRGAALVAEARARGLDVSGETCPHYLALDEEDAERLGAVAKCAPPLRLAAEREALWAALAGGELPMVASDHSPAPPAMKRSDDFFAVWGGISGCQTTLPVLLTEGHAARGVPLALIAAATSGFVARRFRLPEKGALAVGADADLALVDLAAVDELTVDRLLSRHRQSPFLRRRLRGRVVRTIRRGETIQRDGRITVDGGGRLVRPERGADRGDLDEAPARGPLDVREQVEDLDRRLITGQVDEAIWYDRGRRRLTASYLASDDPYRQSGMRADAGRWERGRRPIVAAVDRGGSLLDVGCANGLLMESIERWAADAGHEVAPYGLDLSPELAALARRRLPRWSDRIFVGNVVDWAPPHRFDFVRTELEYVPPWRQAGLVERLLRDVVAPGGRLIVCAYGGSTRGAARAASVGDRLREWGYTLAGEAVGVDANGVVITRVAWVDAEPTPSSGSAPDG